MGFARPDRGPPHEVLSGPQFQGTLLPGQWSVTVLSPYLVKAFPWKMPTLSIFWGPGKPAGPAAALAEAYERCPFGTLLDQSPRHFWGEWGCLSPDQTSG